jgi:hypothetical protein
VAEKLLAGITNTETVVRTAVDAFGEFRAGPPLGRALRSVNRRGSNPGGSAGGGVAPRRRRFRSVYATVLVGVLGVDSELVLGGPFPTFPLM